MSAVLAESYDEIFDSFDKQQQEAFVIDSDQKAEWAIRKIAQNNAERDRRTNICRQQVDFYKDEADRITTRYNNENKGLLGMLERYFNTVAAQNAKSIKKTKTQESYALISGKLVRKFEQQAVIKVDEAALIAAYKGTKYVEDKPALKWAELKNSLAIVEGKVVDDNGEVVTGAAVETKPAAFTVKI